jgi:outer membrane protein assembly factor BamE (lipoprotein component of BamABCDE complex)
MRKDTPLRKASDMKLVRRTALAAALLVTVAATGCASTKETIYNGFVADDQTLALAPVGSSREQVLLSLGTPSATATFDNEVFYYISQKRVRPVAFMQPKLVEQSVLAVYLDKDGNVAKLSHYQLKDGKVFDMISRTTPTGGKELSFLQKLLSGGSQGAAQSLGQSLFGTSKNNY